MLICVVHYAGWLLANDQTSNIVYWAIASNGGYAGVSIFFFLSGYGLSESENKKHLALDQFITRRFWKIYKPFLLVNAICVPVLGYFGAVNVDGTGDFIFKVLGLSAYDPNMWFIKVLFLLYGSFYLASLITDRNYRFVLILLLTVIYLLVALFIDARPCTWLSLFAFPLGVGLSIYKERLAWIVNCRFRTIAGLTVVCLLLFLVLKRIYSADSVVGSGVFALAVHELISVYAVLLLIPMAVGVTVRGSYQSMLGVLSYFIYLIHGKIILLSAALLHGMMPLGLFLLSVVVASFLVNRVYTLTKHENYTGQLRL